MRSRDVRAAVANIRELAAAGYFEAAHAAEDRLFLKLIRSIGRGQCVDPQMSCRIAALSAKVEFPRERAVDEDQLRSFAQPHIPVESED